MNKNIVSMIAYFGIGLVTSLPATAGKACLVLCILIIQAGVSNSHASSTKHERERYGDWTVAFNKNRNTTVAFTAISNGYMYFEYYKDDNCKMASVVRNTIDKGTNDNKIDSSPTIKAVFSDEKSFLLKTKHILRRKSKSGDRVIYYHTNTSEEYMRYIKKQKAATIYFYSKEDIYKRSGYKVSLKGSKASIERALSLCKGERSDSFARKKNSEKHAAQTPQTPQTNSNKNRTKENKRKPYVLSDQVRLEPLRINGHVVGERCHRTIQYYDRANCGYVTSQCYGLVASIAESCPDEVSKRYIQ